jgi:acetyltransferase
MQPYPTHLVKCLTLADGTAVTLRPIRAADARIEQEFVRSLSAEARYFRFMDMLRELSPKMLKQMTEIDYDDQMALIAITPSDKYEVQIAVGRYVVYPGSDDCEFAIIVSDGWQKKGIATAIMRLLIDAARERGLKRMIGEVLASNNNMLHFVRKFGFRLAADPADPRQIRAILDLKPRD